MMTTDGHLSASLLSLLVLLCNLLGTVEAQTRADIYRINCFPEPNVTEEACLNRQCIWGPPKQNESFALRTPYCYFPKTTGYHYVTSEENTDIIKRTVGPNNPPNPYRHDDSDELDLKVKVTKYTDALRVWIGPSTGPKRFEPDAKFLELMTVVENDLLRFDSVNTPNASYSFTVIRKDTGVKIWDTSIGGLLFADQYIQIATYLPSDRMYGWGENVHQTLKHDFSKYTTWGMFGRDEPPNSWGSDQTKNLYGVQPFYMGVEQDGKAHGVLILNANAQEITTGPDPHFVYRTIGGVLDIYFFPGPSPEAVVKQYELLIGTPYMPAYFALGFQLSRYGYVNLQDMKDAVNRTVSAGIPLEIPYADIDYMENFMDFTLSPNFSDFASYEKELHDAGMKLFLMFDMAIDVTSPPFQRALEQGASFLEWPEESFVPQDIQSMYNSTNGTKIMLGVVWPNNHCAFPDFLDPTNATEEWWISEFQRFHDIIKYDGIWIDMNEPANFGTNDEFPWYFTDPDHPYKIPALQCNFSNPDNKYDEPKFQTHNVYYYDTPDRPAKLSDKTVCMLARSNRGKEIVYNTKSLLNLYQTISTYKALREVTKQRGAIITRANFPGTGRYSGHWLGDNNATWDDLRTSVIGIQEYNMFGIPYIGSDICGFHGNTTPELCLRWHQLGAFYTFSRNHNGKPYIRQDPAQWPKVAEATKMAYNFRYSYLSYLYSLHFEASVFGGTVIRPVFFEFPKDPKARDLSYQFMWGSSMLIMPVVYENARTVDGYLPKDAIWYSLRKPDYGHRVFSGSNLSATTEEMIPVFIRGGSIITYQEPAKTTSETRKNPFVLVAAYGEYQMIENQKLLTATGFLYWDDGVTTFESYSFCQFNFTLITKDDLWSKLTVQSLRSDPCEKMPVYGVDIFGFPYEPGRYLTQSGSDISSIDLRSISTSTPSSPSTPTTHTTVPVFSTSTSASTRNTDSTPTPSPPSTPTTHTTVSVSSTLTSASTRNTDTTNASPTPFSTEPVETTTSTKGASTLSAGIITIILLLLQRVLKINA